MEWQQLIISLFEGVFKTLEKALAGLSKDELNYQPNRDCNTIGWIAWHLARTQDRFIANLNNNKQVWTDAEWYKKFNRSADANDTGFGHTSVEVSEFKSPDVSVLLGYYQAVLEKTTLYLSGLNSNDLNQKTVHPKFTTLGVWLGALLSDNIQHAGQIAYIRGLIKGKGWMDA